jgi:hypothetical protein
MEGFWSTALTSVWIGPRSSLVPFIVDCGASLIKLLAVGSNAALVHKVFPALVRAKEGGGVHCVPLILIPANLCVPKHGCHEDFVRMTVVEGGSVLLVSTRLIYPARVGFPKFVELIRVVALRVNPLSCFSQENTYRFFQTHKY